MKNLIILVFATILYLAANAQSTNMNLRIKAMAEEKDPKMNILAMQEIINDFKLDAIKNAEDIDVLKGQVALSMLKAHQFLQFENYIHQIKNKFNQTSYLNMAVYILLKDKQLDYANTIAQKTVSLYESFKGDPAARPSSFPVDDWNRFMKMANYPYYQAYAEVLYANGALERALYYQEKAQRDIAINNLMPSSIEFYTTLLEANGQTEKAYQLLLQMAGTGKASIGMNKQLKAMLVNKMGNEKAANFIDSIQRNSNQTYQNEVAKKLLNQVAPYFSLLDLKGKQVSLTDLKGKIVVIDFWATWCAPCIASMPAMREVSNKHPEVVFLFVAIKETGGDVANRIKTYIEKEKFPLNVLIDQPMPNDPKIFKMATAYQLKGLPTKVLIDKKGKLRFSVEGYSSDAELIAELEAMIAVAKHL